MESPSDRMRAGRSFRTVSGVTVAFTAANVRYPLLGIAGCLEFLDARFLGQRRLLELEANPSLPTLFPP